MVFFMLFLPKVVQIPHISHRFSSGQATMSDQEHLSPDDLGFVVAAVARRANEMAMHVYGCRIIQRPGPCSGGVCPPERGDEPAKLWL